jgi:hypothetical protein
MTTTQEGNMAGELDVYGSGDMDWGTVYTNPARVSLEVVGSVGWTDEDYSFNLTVVWRDQQGKLYMADDAGCSCPSPFEDFHSIDDLQQVTPMVLAAHLQERLASPYVPSSAAGEVAELLTKAFA